MPSIIPGYEYDIFVSYRQKDNKHDGWVTEFVDNLKGELESTFKEAISVYFDINPHDGLLETHDVDASLKEKLKCLIFIPIISRTYCDPKSFAWEHEFKAFVELASSDQFGLKVKLPDSNIANRVLPVQIYDLNAEDRKLVEGELGGYLRGIEFIYKESGVNRPLMAIEDHPDNNLNKTFYRNQINKVANAINEIINGLRSPNRSARGITEKIDEEKLTTPKHLNPKIIILAITVLVLILLGYFYIPKLFKSSESVEKSIAVLPFHNMTNDPEQEYLSEGIMEEILNHLFKIGGLKIPSSTSSMRFKGSKLSIREIAKELNVSYVLEGNVYRSGDNVRVIVRLINGDNERLLWTDDYKEAITADNLLEMQSDVAQKVADNMNVVINPEAKKRIEVKPTLNTEAYILFLQAWNQLFPFGRSKLERAISLDPGYADAYALLAGYWVYSGGFAGDKSRDQVLENAEPLLKKALQLDNNCLFAHYYIARLSLYYNWDFKTVEKEFQVFSQLNPSNPDVGGFSDYLLASENYREALLLAEKAFNQNKSDGSNWVQLALSLYYNNQPDKALDTLEFARQLFPDDEFLFANSVRIWDYLGKYDKAIELFEKNTANINIHDIIPYYLGHLGIAYFKTGNKIKSATLLSELLIRSRKSPIGSPSFFAAAIYIAMGDKNNSLQMLEKAYSDHEVEMYWLKVEPLFRPLHEVPQFENLLFKIGLK
jgi:TolB-like protein